MKKIIRTRVMPMVMVALMIIALVPNNTNTTYAGSHDQDLLTIQNGVSTRSGQFIDAYYDLGVEPGASPVAVLNYTLAALYKNQDTANANQELIDMLAISTWNATIPGKSQDFYFEIPNLVLIWELFNQNSSAYPGRLTTDAEAAIKQWLFDHADSSSHLADADLSEIWFIDGSENHDLIRRGTYFFMTDILKDDPAYKNLTLQDGYTVEEHSNAWEQYYTFWFNERARKGTFIEIGTPIYMKYSMPYIYIMRDFGPSDTIKDHADQFLTLVFADYAQEYTNGARAGAKARSYRGKYSNFGSFDSMYGFSHLYFNYGKTTNVDMGLGSYTMWPAITSDYTVPLTVMDIALYPESKGNYTYVSTRPASDAVEDYTVSFPSNIRRYSYITPGYINGVFTIDTSVGSYNSGDYLLLNEQNRFMGVVFSGNSDTRAYLNASDNYASSYSDLNGIADGNAMILHKPNNAVRDGATNIYLSADLFGQKEESNGWIFTKDPNGTGYLAVKPASGTITSWSDFVWNRGPVGTYVTNGVSADTNYSTSTDLRVKNNASDGSIAYLTIGHPGDVEVESSKLRIYANDLSGTPVVKVYGITDDSWDKKTMTWNDGSPNHASTGYAIADLGTSATYIDSVTVNGVDAYYEIDVTSFVNSQIGQSDWKITDHVFSFMLMAENDDGSYVTFNSGEALDNKPQLESIAGKHAILSDEHSPVVFQTALDSDYADFDSFKTDVLNNTFVWNTSTEFEYQGTGSASLKYYTDDTLPKVGNTTVDLNPSKTYDSPYLSSDYDSPIITITNTSNESLVLDFSDVPTLPTETPVIKGEWLLDETSGMDANDSSGNNYDGTVNGATWTSGYMDNALSFDGTDDYVELPTTTGMDTKEGTVSMWVNKTNSDLGMLFYGAGDVNGNGFGSGDEFHLHFGDGIGIFIQGDAQGVNIGSSATYNDGLWHHVAATWDFYGDVVLYVDGVQVAAGSHDADFDFSVLMRLGGTAQLGNRFYNGMMDHVKVYEVPLTAAQIQNLALEAPLPTPVGEWALDETSGTVADDASSNNYDGTVNGATWTTGYINNGLSFDGIDDYVELPTTTGMGTTEGSVSMWVNKSNTDFGAFFYGAADPNGDGFGGGDELHLHFGDGIGIFIQGNTQSVNIGSSATYNDGLWHHVAATWDTNGNVILYVDGAQVASGTHDASFDFLASMRLGGTARSGNRFYNGLLDHVKVYDVALSASQVAELAEE